MKFPDWQSISALAIVLATVGVLGWNAVRRLTRSGSGGCGGGCGCGKSEVLAKVPVRR